MTFKLIVIPASLVLFGSAFAQFAYRGDVTLGVNTGTNNLRAPTPTGEFERTSLSNFQIGLNLHLEVDYTLDDFGTYLALDPEAVLNDAGEGGVRLELTELYARYTLGPVDVSAGLERLPLETARLNVPYSLSEVRDPGSTDEPKGSFEGLLGARVTWYPKDTRVRLAGFYGRDSGGVSGAGSVKRYFGGFELEGHVVYCDGLTFGLGGSGLVGSTVVYGEGWLLLDTDTNVRALLGATGYFGDSLWTLEGGPFPSLASTSSYPQLTGQLQVPQGDATWIFRAGAGLPESGALGVLGASVNVVDGSVSSILSISAGFSEVALTVGVGLELTGAF